MTAKWARGLVVTLAIVFPCAVVAQDQVKPNRTISYFTKGDPKYSDVISALGDEPKCATVDVNVHSESASWLPSGGRSTKVDPTHETWWLTASPKAYSGYKKYRYNYMLEPPGTLTLKDLVAVVSDSTSNGLARRVCSQVTGTPRGARIHVK